MIGVFGANSFLSKSGSPQRYRGHREGDLFFPPSGDTDGGKERLESNTRYGVFHRPIPKEPELAKYLSITLQM
jgi:hypothetical protein